MIPRPPARCSRSDGPPPGTWAACTAARILNGAWGVGRTKNRARGHRRFLSRPRCPRQVGQGYVAPNKTDPQTEPDSVRPIVSSSRPFRGRSPPPQRRAFSRRVWAALLSRSLWSIRPRPTGVRPPWRRTYISAVPSTTSVALGSSRGRAPRPSKSLPTKRTTAVECMRIRRRPAALPLHTNHAPLIAPAAASCLWMERRHPHERLNSRQIFCPATSSTEIRCTASVIQHSS